MLLRVQLEVKFSNFFALDEAGINGAKDHWDRPLTSRTFSMVIYVDHFSTVERL